MKIYGKPPLETFEGDFKKLEALSQNEAFKPLLRGLTNELARSSKEPSSRTNNTS